MAWYIKITAPDGSCIQTGGCTRADLPPADPFSAAQLTVVYSGDYATHGVETLATNPARLNCMAEAYWGSTRMFKGRVRSVTRDVATSTVTLMALDRLADLNSTRAGTDNGDATFLERMPTATISDKTLYPGPAEPDCEAPYYPAFGADCWAYFDDALPDTTLDANTALNSATLVTASTVDEGFPPRGFLSIQGGQLVYYDGYHPASVGGKYTFYNVQWEQCGTSGGANPILAGCHLGHARPFPINAAKPILLHGQYDAAPLWEDLHSGWYTVRPDAGRFDFKGDPTSAPWSYLAIRAWTYDVIDEQAVGRITVGSLVADLLEYSGTGGPGLAAGDYSITIDDIPLPYAEARLTSQQFTLPAIQALVGETVYSPYNSAYKAVFTYDAATDKYKLLPLAQAGTPDIYIGAATAVSESLSLDGYATGVSVQYNRASPSLISPTRMWHAAVGAPMRTRTGTTASNTEAIYWQVKDAEMARGWNADTDPGNNRFTYFLMDGNDATGWGAGLPGSSSTDDTLILFAWFGGTKQVERVRAVFDLRRVVYSGITVSVIGVTSYTPGTPPTVSGFVELSDLLTLTIGTGRAGITLQGQSGVVDRAMLGRRMPALPNAGRVN